MITETYIGQRLHYVSYIQVSGGGPRGSNSLPQPKFFPWHLSHFSSARLQLQLLQEGLVVLGAVGMAGTGSNDHDWFPDDLP